jgi:hypothetical protein
VSVVWAQRCKIGRFKASGDALEREREEGNGTGEMTRRCFSAPKSARIGYCPAELRRGISLWLVDDSVKEQREMEEDGEGVFIGLGARQKGQGSNGE